MKMYMVQYEFWAMSSNDMGYDFYGYNTYDKTYLVDVFGGAVFPETSEIVELARGENGKVKVWRHTDNDIWHDVFLMRKTLKEVHDYVKVVILNAQGREIDTLYITIDNNEESIKKIAGWATEIDGTALVAYNSKGEYFWELDETELKAYAQR